MSHSHFSLKFPLRLAALCFLASSVVPSVTSAQAPVFAVTPVESSIKFFVKASVALTGNFDKWNATLTVFAFEKP